MGFDMSKLLLLVTGAAKYSKSLFAGTRNVSGGKAHKRSAAEEASQQRPRAGDELSYEMLLQRIRSRRVVPFVGAGMSMPLLPSWSGVLKDVAKNLHVDLAKHKEESAPVITEILRVKANAKKGTILPNDRCGLTDEFLKVFKECISRSRISDGRDPDFNAIDMLTLGIKPKLPANVRDRDLFKTLRSDALLQALVLIDGPWPLIMTTNWDTLLEAAYHYRNGLDVRNPTDILPPANIGPVDYPTDRHCHRLGVTPQVRYRANVQQVFAELRAGLNPPRLLKLHGDFTKGGRQEMVAGHADYRHLMVHEVAFARLMQYICSNYSLLFFGCSLTDPDLLATLDNMVESLGGEVGPHFWLTADDVSDAKVDFLQRYYSVFTVRTPEKERFIQADNLLGNASDEGWQMARPLKFKALSFGLGSWVQGGSELQLILESSSPEVVLKRSTSAVPVAVGFSCGCDKEGYPMVGPQGQAMLGHRYDLPREERPRFDIQDMKGLWRALPWQEGDPSFWPVCGKNVEGSGSQGSLFEAVQHFIQRASWKIYTGDLDPPEDAYRPPYSDNVPANHDDLLKQRQERANYGKVQVVDKASQLAAAAALSKPPKPSRIVLCLPLIMAGAKTLNSHEVLSATVSAIGSISRDYLPPCPVDIVLCLSAPDLAPPLGRLALMADIQGGRMDIGDILSRSVSGHMEFTCIAPPFTRLPLDKRNGAVTEDQRHWRCRRIVIPLDATVNDLRRQMDFTDCDGACYHFYTGEASLLSLDIYDGSVVKLNDYGVVEV